MPKDIKIIILFILPLLILGCTINDENLYEGYKHYDLKDKNNINEYDYEGNIYILTDISDNKIVGYNGLFYKISDNDYILIKKIETNPGYTAKDQIGKEYSYFIEDKLYTVRNLGLNLNEYTLNKEKVEERNLIFNMSNVYDEDKEHLLIYGIDKVDSKNIYYKATITKDINSNATLKCSLKELICVVV